MAVANVIKFTEQESLLIWKWHDENYSKRRDEIRLGSQLIVGENQQAIFVKGGKVCDIFETGQHTLATSNLPILSQLFAGVFGGDSPIQASIYFINKSVFMNAKFGLSPFNLIEPNFIVPIPVSARGTYAVRIKDGRNLLVNLVGNSPDFSLDKLKEYFRSLVITNVKSEIINISRTKNISPIELETQITLVNDSVNKKIISIFNEYGLEIRHFLIEAIPIIDDDPKVKDIVTKVHELMSKDIEEKMKFKRHAENLDIYKMERQFDITQSAAENIGNNGIAGALLGLNSAGMIGQNLAGIAAASFQNNREYITCDKCGTKMPVGKKFCEKCGDKFILCPACKKDNPSESKFCIFCGSSMKLICNVCGSEYTAGAMFCGECGTKLKQ
ncbi:MAG: SPFH domain-containing protein [Treponema sp.]|nr:SPFH domain-containing protein [Treponema sp.]